MLVYLLIPFFALAQDLESEKYCFPSEMVRVQAERHLNSILVPSDTVSPLAQCLTISMRPHRRELIQKFIASSFPDVAVTFSSAEIKRDPCLLKIEKIKTSSTDKKEVSVDGNSGTVSSEASTENKTEVMQIQTLKDFGFQVDQSEASGSCRFINKDRYEISITIAKNPRPNPVTAMPPGTIVVMNRPPEDQETAKLTTVVQLNRGEKLDLGSIVKDLRNKSNKINLETGLKGNTTEGSSGEVITLSFQ